MSILKSIKIYGLGYFISKAIVFFLVPIYSFFLTKEQIGFYDLIYNLNYIIVPVITVQMSEGIYRFLLNNNEEEQKVVISSAFYFLIFMQTLFILFYGILYYVYPLENHILIGLQFITLMLLPFFQQLARGLKQVKVFAMSGVINTFFILVLNLILLKFFSPSLKSIFLAIALSNFIAIAYIFSQVNPLKYINRSYFNKNKIKEILKYTTPFIPNVASWWIMGPFNAFLITKYLGLGENGIFSIANRYVSIVAIINTVYYFALQDLIIEKHESNNVKNYSNSFKTFLIFEFSVIIICSIFSKFFTKYFVDDKFSESWIYITPLLLSVGLASITNYFGTAYLAKKETKDLFYSYLFGALVNIIVVFFTIQQYGLWAVCLGLILGNLVVVMYRFFQTKDFFNLLIPLKSIFVYFGILVYGSYWMYFNTNTTSLIINIFVVILLLILVNKKYIINIFSKYGR